MSPERAWSLGSARAMLDEVRNRTERAVGDVDRLLAERESCAADDPRRAELEERIRGAVGDWARAIEALGADVKGLWLVDFDNGRGYYCWKWPEPGLEFYHGYEEGFDGRVRIQ